MTNRTQAPVGLMDLVELLVCAEVGTQNKSTFETRIERYGRGGGLVVRMKLRRKKVVPMCRYR